MSNLKPIESNEEFTKVSHAVTTLTREWSKLNDQLNRMRGNLSMDKKTGETWGDKFNSQSMRKQLFDVWERVSQPQEIKGEREDGTRFDFVLPAWTSFELARLAQIGKGARRLEDYDQKLILSGGAEMLGLEEDDDSTDF